MLNPNVGEPHGSAGRLKVARIIADEKLADQISLGQEFIDYYYRSYQSLDEGIEEQQRWDKANQELLRELFEDVGVVWRYISYKGDFDLYEDDPLAKQAVDFKEQVGRCLDALRQVRNELYLYDEPLTEAVQSTNPTNHHEDGVTLEVFDVFLSHAAADNDLAVTIWQLLENSKVRIFTTPVSIESGVWEPKIEQALQHSRHLWLLLTPAALEQSTWVHQEFGYFYGYHIGKGLNNVDQRLHYIEPEGNSVRPGLYQHFQGTPVPSFEDPVAIARTIAGVAGKAFREPPEPERLRVQLARTKALSHPEVRLTGGGSTGHLESRTQDVTLHLSSSETIFNVDAIVPDGRVAVGLTRPVPQVPGGDARVLLLTFSWGKEQEFEKDISDSFGRVFTLDGNPAYPGSGEPLIITFQTESGDILGAVTYITIDTHPKAYPDVSLVAPGAPFGWLLGQKK